MRSRLTRLHLVAQLADDLEQRRGLDLALTRLRAADVKRAESTLVVGGYGDVLEDAIDLLLAEVLAPQARPGARGHQLLGARTCGHTRRGDANHPPCATGQRDGATVERVDLLRGD